MDIVLEYTLFWHLCFFSQTKGIDISFSLSFKNKWTLLGEKKSNFKTAMDESFMIKSLYVSLKAVLSGNMYIISHWFELYFITGGIRKLFEIWHSVYFPHKANFYSNNAFPLFSLSTVTKCIPKAKEAERVYTTGHERYCSGTVSGYCECWVHGWQAVCFHWPYAWL